MLCSLSRCCRHRNHTFTSHSPEVLPAPPERIALVARVGDVVAVEDGTRLVLAYAHGDFLWYSIAHHVADRRAPQVVEQPPDVERRLQLVRL